MFTWEKDGKWGLKDFTWDELHDMFKDNRHAMDIFYGIFTKLRDYEKLGTPQEFRSLKFDKAERQEQVID